MKKACILLVLMIISVSASAQIDGTLFLGLTPVSNADIATITSPSEGSLFYNTDERKIYLNTGTGFTGIPSLDTNSIDFWSVLGSSGTDSALNFLGTTDAQDMVFRANNQERLRLSGSNQTVLLNGAAQFDTHPFIIRANGDDIMAFQTATGVTEWHWNLAGNGLNFVETGVADFRIFMEQGGNIGINTDTPSERLDVNGTLRVRNIATTTSNLDVLVTTTTGLVQKRPFSDFSGSTGISKLNFGGRWTNTDIATNLNVNNLDVPIFGTESYKDDGNNLYEVNVTNDALTVKEAGRYDIRANLSLLGINDTGNTEQRTNVNARIFIDGNPVGALSATGYIRFQTNGNFQTSIHINEILELSSNNVITIVTFQESNTGEVNFSATGESSFVINKLR